MKDVNRYRELKREQRRIRLANNSQNAIYQQNFSPLFKNDTTNLSNDDFGINNIPNVKNKLTHSKYDGFYVNNPKQNLIFEDIKEQSQIDNIQEQSQDFYADNTNNLSNINEQQNNEIEQIQNANYDDLNGQVVDFNNADYENFEEENVDNQLNGGYEEIVENGNFTNEEQPANNELENTNEPIDENNENYFQMEDDLQNIELTDNQFDYQANSQAVTEDAQLNAEYNQENNQDNLTEQMNNAEIQHSQIEEEINNQEEMSPEQQGLIANDASNIIDETSNQDANLDDSQDIDNTQSKMNEQKRLQIAQKEQEKLENAQRKEQEKQANAERKKQIKLAIAQKKEQKEQDRLENDIRKEETKLANDERKEQDRLLVLQNKAQKRQEKLAFAKVKQQKRQARLNVLNKKEQEKLALLQSKAQKKQKELLNAEKLRQNKELQINSIDNASKEFEYSKYGNLNDLNSQMVSSVVETAKWKQRIKNVGVVLTFLLIVLLAVVAYVVIRPQRSLSLSIDDDYEIILNDGKDKGIKLNDPVKLGDSYVFNFKVQVKLVEAGNYTFVFDIKNDKNYEIVLCSNDYIVTRDMITVQNIEANSTINLLSGIEIKTDKLSDISIEINIDVEFNSVD